MIKLYIAFALGGIIGWLLCACVTSGRIRDLEELAAGRLDMWLREKKIKESNSR